MRGALLCGRSTVFGREADGFVVATPHVPLVCVVGRPDHALIAEAIEFARDDGDHPPVLTVDAAATAHVTACLPGWQRERAILHTRPLGAPLPAAPAGAVVLEQAAAFSEARLAHLPDDLLWEIEDASRHGPVAYALVENLPVAFCYAPWTTERWFDISVETLESYRGRGLGTAVASALITRMEATGRRPVWGAVESNAASRALAARLGFSPAGEATVFTL